MKTATILKLPMADDDRLVCKECGVDAGCGCNAPKIKAGERAANMVMDRPELADTTIADMCHVHHSTVARARARLCANAQTPKKVRGKDGRLYNAKKPVKPKKLRPHKTPDPSWEDPMQEDCNSCTTDEERWQNSAASFLADVLRMRAYWDRQFGKHNVPLFERPSTLRTLADDAERAFVEVLKTIRGD